MPTDRQMVNSILTQVPLLDIMEVRLKMTVQKTQGRGVQLERDKHSALIGHHIADPCAFRARDYVRNSRGVAGHHKDEQADVHHVDESYADVRGP